MRSFNDALAEIGHWLGFFFVLITGIYFLLSRFGWLEASVVNFLNGPGKEIYIAWVVFSLLLAVFFIRRLVILYQLKARIMTVGSRGPIWISPSAVRDFILKTLEEQLGLTNARVTLQMKGNKGIAVKIRASVPLTKPLTDLGERIQEIVKSNLEGRIGIKVENVEVFARSITTTYAGKSAPSEDAEEYTPLEIPNREHYE
jgi:uncharacterized alkaline shock family protein YloU